MGNGGPGSSGERHDLNWQYLDGLDYDIALLQETRELPQWATERNAGAVWAPKYARRGTGQALWGCAVISRSIDLEPVQPAADFPWLRQFEGSTAIAYSASDSLWLASVHFHYRPVPPEVSSLHSSEGVETAPDGSAWEANLIPHEFRRLFGGQSFVWGGDLNADPRMDDRRGFVGGNRRMFEVYNEHGFVDTRARFHDDFQRTYVKTGRGEYQLDHVFADEQTERRVSGWEVDLAPATQAQPLSDHAPVLLTIDS